MLFFFIQIVCNPFAFAEDLYSVIELPENFYASTYRRSLNSQGQIAGGILIEYSPGKYIYYKAAVWDPLSGIKVLNIDEKSSFASVVNNTGFAAVCCGPNSNQSDKSLLWNLSTEEKYFGPNGQPYGDQLTKRKKLHAKTFQLNLIF